MQSDVPPDFLIQIGVVLIVICFASIIVRIYFKDIKILRKLSFYIGGVSFGCLFIIYLLNGMRENHNYLINLASSNKCKVVEGYVEHFHPMPSSGHDSESFSVSGVPFRYSDFEITGAFNNAASHGGPIKEGLKLRINYVTSNKQNLILKIELIES